MSRAYRIRVSESVTKTVHVEDGLTFRLEILDVLGKERTKALLTEELKKEGFSEGEGGKLVKKVDDVEVEIDAETGEVEVSLDATEVITRAGSRSGAVANPDAGREAMSRDLQRDLERKIDEEATSVQAEITAELEKRIPALRQQLDNVSNRVMAAALKEKARQLGEIEELSENEETGELTIRVRV